MSDTDNKCMFNEGDVVRLKSGGDPMTVVMASTMDKPVQCSWFQVVGYDEIHRIPLHGTEKFTDGFNWKSLRMAT